MPERSSGITPIAACGPAAVAAREMRVAESLDESLVGPSQIQSRALGPVAKVSRTVEVAMDGAPCMTALGQIALQCLEVHALPDMLLERAVADAVDLGLAGHCRLPEVVEQGDSTATEKLCPVQPDSTVPRRQKMAQISAPPKSIFA